MRKMVAHFAKINRPTAGATHEKVLPVGDNPLQLYSLATPNGVKVTIMLEELLALGHSEPNTMLGCVELGMANNLVLVL